MKRALVLLSLGLFALIGSGCTTVSTTSASRPVQIVRADGLSVGDLLVMLNSGKPQAEIVNEIHAKGLRASASASDIDVLAQNGASKEVIDAVNANAHQNTTVATTTTTYPAGYGVWPWFGFSYWSGYPYGYGYGYSRGPNYYYRPPVVVAPGPFYRPPIYSNPGFGFRGGHGGFSGGGGGGRGGGGMPSIPRFGRR